MTSLAYLFAVIGLCVLGAAYQTQTGWLYLLGAAALGLVPLSWATARWDLAGARVRLRPVPPASQGSTVTLDLAVERDAPGQSLGMQLLLPDSQPRRLFKWWRGHLVPANWHARPVGPLSRGGRAEVTFALPATRRGEFPLPSFYLQSGFPLGLVALARPVASTGTFMVYPVGPRLNGVPWLDASRRERGERQRFEAGPGSAPRGVREYRPGDPWRQIHWRTTARLGQPHVKETEREEGDMLLVYLDMRPEVHTPASVEHVVTIAASLLDHARANGREVELRTQPAATPVDVGSGELRLLTWLARVNPAEGADAPGGAEGAVLISPTYVAGWQRWAANFIYTPTEAANPMDATVFCPVGDHIPEALGRERQP